MLHYLDQEWFWGGKDLLLIVQSAMGEEHMCELKDIALK